MSERALKRPEYLEPVFKKVYGPEDRIDPQVLAKYQDNRNFAVAKDESGGYRIEGLSRDGKYMEIHIDAKTSEAALKALSRIGKERPTGVTQIMRSLYAKFDRYEGIDAEEAKLITRAFLAIKETGPDEARVAYQPKYFKKADVNEQHRKSIDSWIADTKKYKTPDAWVNAMDADSIFAKRLLEDFQAASKKVPKYRPNEVGRAIDFYMKAFHSLKTKEELENAPTERPTTKATPVRVETVLPREKKKPGEDQLEIIGRVLDYIEPMKRDRGGKLTGENVKTLDPYAASVMLRDFKAVDAMFDEYKLPAQLVRAEIQRMIKLLEEKK